MSVVDAYRRIIGAQPASQRAGPRRPTPVRQRWPTVTMGRHVCAGGPGSGGMSLASKIGACCPAQCGRCGGAGCDKFPGGLEACCPGELVKANKSCDDFEPPCMVPKYRSAFIQSRTKRWNDSFLQQHNLMLIHIPKTGGTSLEDSCPSSHCIYPRFCNASNLRLLNHTCIVSDPHHRNQWLSPWHMPPDLYETHYGQPYDTENKKRMCIVRHPADRYQSEQTWGMMKNMAWANRPKDPQKLGRSYLAAQDAEKPVKWSEEELHFMPQHFFVWTRSGDVQCHCVVAFERLANLTASHDGSTRSSLAPGESSSSAGCSRYGNGSRFVRGRRIPAVGCDVTHVKRTQALQKANLSHTRSRMTHEFSHGFRMLYAADYALHASALASPTLCWAPEPQRSEWLGGEEAPPPPPPRKILPAPPRATATRAAGGLKTRTFYGKPS